VQSLRIGSSTPPFSYWNVTATAGREGNGALAGADEVDLSRGEGVAMRQSTVAIALLATAGVSLPSLVWWSLRDGDLERMGSRIESASSTRPRHPDATIAADLVSVQLSNDHHYCHWHQGNKLNSPAWWLAEYYGRVQERHPKEAQLAELESLIATIELGMSSADAAIEESLKPAVIDRIGRNDFDSGDSIDERNRDSVAIPSSRTRLVHGLAGLPDGDALHYDGVIRGMSDRRWVSVKIHLGDWPSLDAALDTKATVHHEAPKRIQRLIESFK
jgi:hypothetical protein